MAFNITFQPGGQSIPVQAGQTVLQAAQDAGIGLPCGCRNGACGACKGKVLEGRVDHGNAQENALPESERAAGLALFCCARPLEDLVLAAPALAPAGALPVKTLPCRVQRLEKLADDVMRMTLKLPTNERLQFRAGQYIEFLLKDGKRRAFSLANAPHDDAFLELHLRLIPGGTFTEHVFHVMREKEILRIEGPHGSFFLREEVDKPVILVAGGTGFAPVKAIIEHALHLGMTRPMTLYRGAKRRADLYLDALARQWTAQHAHIRYVPVLSEPAADDAWDGRTGLVHEAVLADFAAAAMPDGLAGHQVYACGAPAMIDAARRDFTAHGLPADAFFADVFSFATPAAPAAPCPPDTKG